MKKYLFFVFLFLFSLLSVVLAKEQVFSFIIHDDVLYYDSKLLKEDDFSQILNLSEQKEFSNTFTFKNDSNRKIPLYLFLESKEEDGSYANLFDYLTLKVSMDDKVLYDDSASILNYASNTNLYDYISLGDISKNSSCALQFDLQLSSEYQKISNNKFAYLHYSFYSLDSDKDYVEIKPFSKEKFYLSFGVWMFCIVCIIFAFVLLTIIYIIRKRNYNRIHKKTEKNMKKEPLKK